MKICTLSPQGNGQRMGGITRFSGALKRKNIDNFFWELNSSSWNGSFVDWEGIPFSLQNKNDEDDLAHKLNEYDVIINNWPTATTNEHNAYNLWQVIKRLEKPLLITVIHNTILSSVRKENLSPLIWSFSDYIFVQVSDDSTLVTELISRMPWLKDKFVQFRQTLDIDEFKDKIAHSFYRDKKNIALWVGRWENCRNSARWSKVLNDAKSENFNSSYFHCAMGLDSDVKTYWGFFANDKGNHLRLNKYEIKKGSEILDSEGSIDLDHKDISKNPNEFHIFGKYEYESGMNLLQKSKWGISIFGAWRDDLVNDYKSLAKLEYASLEIMLLSIPVFDLRHLFSMKEKTLFEADWVLKNNHNATKKENVELLKQMEHIGDDENLYNLYRESNIDYVKRYHSVESFLNLIEQCVKRGKTNRKTESEVLRALYNTDIELSPDLWVSLLHTSKGLQHVIEWETSDFKKSPEMKIVRKKSIELF